MTQVIKAPNTDYTIVPKQTSVFLAGSIEMGTAEDWQDKVTSALIKANCVDFIFNPRRDDWDSSWTQSIHDKQFSEQVNWELDHINSADIVFFYFAPSTKSPITLMELGICTHNQPKVIVVCPDGFWRKGNIEVVCSRYKIPLLSSLDTGIKVVVDYFSSIKSL